MLLFSLKSSRQGLRKVQIVQDPYDEIDSSPAARNVRENS